MSERRFSRAEIERLAQKLGSQSDLTDREKQLLLAIFAAAGTHVSHSGPADTEDITLTDLRRQLLKAFIPDDGDDFIISGPNIEW